VMDGYRKGWALRYLREAKAELEAARKMPYMAPSLVAESIRKARNAVYYSLGEPAFIELIVREASERTHEIRDPVLKCLVDIETAVQSLTQMQDLDGEKVLKKADDLVQLATDIVETLTDEKTRE